MVNSFVEGLAEIAAGNIAVAANFLEGTMRKAMPIVIGFLANQVGLGGIGKRVGELIVKARKLVDDALTWLVNKAVNTAFALFEKLLAMGKKAASAVVGWVKRLLGLEKRFKADDGSDHRLFFQAKGSDVEFMINPTVINYVTWVNAIEVPAGSTKAAKKAKALEKAKEIDAERKSTVTGAEAEEAKAATIRGMMDELSVLTAPLFTGAKPPCSKDAATGLTFGGLHGGLYGSTMTATTLTNIGMPAGSVPAVTHHEPFLKINRRRNKKGSYYILGHLLNHNIGGTGKEWYNLTPLTRDANSAHEKIAEARIKTAAIAGNIVSYSVRAVYGRPKKTSADPDINEIMKHETQVPTHLECEAELIVPSEISVSGKEVRSALVPAGTIIENNVSQDEADYELTGTTDDKIYLNSGNKKKIAAIQGFGLPVAEKIVAAWREKMKTEGTRFASFAALADYVFADGTKFTATEKNAINNHPDYVGLYEP